MIEVYIYSWDGFPRSCFTISTSNLKFTEIISVFIVQVRLAMQITSISRNIAVWATAMCPMAFASPTQCQGSGIAANLTTPIAPNLDPWYKVPENITSYEPGAIIRHRSPQNRIAGYASDPINLVSSHHILYRTTDSLGGATATALTVLVPHNADFTKVLSYQIATDSSYVNCAPSYGLQRGHANDGTQVSGEEIFCIQAALGMGWVVIVPDFLGPRSAYLANALAGQAVLDGIRAARASTSFTGIYKNPTIAIWGYSGGSLATMWAAEIQPTYAPELTIAGAAVGGIIANLSTVMATVNKGLLAGLIPSATLGLMNQYPELAPIIEEQILPPFKDAFFRANSQCILADLVQFANRNVLDMFKDPDVFYTNPTILKIMQENSLGQRTPKIPMFVYKGMKDEVSSYQDADALVDNYCRNGAMVQYYRDSLASHGPMTVFAAPTALSWLNNVFEQRTLALNCSTTTVDSSLFDVSGWNLFRSAQLSDFIDLVRKHLSTRS